MAATKAADPQKSELDPATQRKTHKVEPGKVQKGHVMAFLYYAVVDSVKPGGDLLDVTGLDNKQGSFSVHGVELIRNALSADLYEEEEKVTKTRAAEILISSHNRPLTVVYIKADGKERTLRGRLVSAEPLLGRSHVEDLDIDESKGTRMRLVDHRTIVSLIVDCVKYIVK